MNPEPSAAPDPMESVWIVVPAYNEAGIIREVLTGLFRLYSNVIVVDDCSIDATGALASAAGAHLVRHNVNLGQGAALRTGIALALQKGAGYIVTFDADGQHRSADIAALLAALNGSGADFALGSRFLGSATGLDLTRRLLLKGAVLFSRMTTGLDVTDAHNGLRAFTRRGASVLRIRQNRMAHASEILHEISKSRLNFVEVPVTIDYTQYSKAKGQKLTGAVVVLWELLTGRLRR